MDINKYIDAISKVDNNTYPFILNGYSESITRNLLREGRKLFSIDILKYKDGRYVYTPVMVYLVDIVECDSSYSFYIKEAYIAISDGIDSIITVINI